MKPTLDRHVGPVLAALVLEIAAVSVVWLLAGFAAAGYSFPWVVMAAERIANWPYAGDLWLLLAMLQFALNAVIAGLALGGNRVCRWLLLGLLLFHALGVCLCSPWKLGHGF